LPRPPVLAAPSFGAPELFDTSKRFSPVAVRPCGLVKTASATWPMICFVPFEYTPVIMPELSTLNDSMYPML